MRVGTDPATDAAALGELPLVGAGGEPASLRRILASHGVASLPPNVIDPDGARLATTLAVGGRAFTVALAESRPGRARLSLLSSPPLAPGEAEALKHHVRHILRLDEDLSPFYARIANDRLLSWAAAASAGRLMRGASVFEDVVKTVCTTNCSWSATRRMVGALVGHLGTDSGYGQAFPGPEALADAPPDFYREVVRAGYRGPYLQSLARTVAEGALDLEGLSDPALPDAEVERRLRALPGVGPYAAAHIMLMGLGRWRYLVLDSWTRPTYARLSGRTADDAAIRRRFRRYGDKAGLAFWLFVTRDWIDD